VDKHFLAVFGCLPLFFGSFPLFSAVFFFVKKKQSFFSVAFGLELVADCNGEDTEKWGSQN